MENGKWEADIEWYTDGRTTIGRATEDVVQRRAFDTTRVGRLPCEI